MDKLSRYRDIVRKVIQEYAGYKPSNGEIETEAIIDPNKDHYEVVHVGWDAHRRIHGSMIHLDIINDKIWVQFDGTDRPVAEELVAAGIPKEDIVLAFKPPHIRQHTGYGVG